MYEAIKKDTNTFVDILFISDRFLTNQKTSYVLSRQEYLAKCNRPNQ